QTCALPISRASGPSSCWSYAPSSEPTPAAGRSSAGGSQVGQGRGSPSRGGSLPPSTRRTRSNSARNASSSAEYSSRQGIPSRDASSRWLRPRRLRRFSRTSSARGGAGRSPAAAAGSASRPRPPPGDGAAGGGAAGPPPPARGGAGKGGARRRLQDAQSVEGGGVPAALRHHPPPPGLLAVGVAVAFQPDQGHPAALGVTDRI